MQKPDDSYQVSSNLSHYAILQTIIPMTIHESSTKPKNFTPQNSKKNLKLSQRPQKIQKLFFLPFIVVAIPQSRYDSKQISNKKIVFYYKICVKFLFKHQLSQKCQVK